MGIAYFACLCGVVAVMALSLLARASGQFVWYPMSVYALFLLAWMIGSVVYARRTALGVKAPRSPEARAERARAELVTIREGILNHAYGFAMHGNRAGAMQYIEAYIASDEDTPEARLWMLNRMLNWEDSAVPLEFGQRLIEYCDQRGLVQEAARVRLQCEHMTAGMQAQR
jgi:hypothetical protein